MRDAEEQDEAIEEEGGGHGKNAGKSATVEDEVEDEKHGGDK